MPSDNLMLQNKTSVIKHFALRDSTTGQLLSGKIHSDFTGWYNIAGGAEVTLSFSSGAVGDSYTSGKLVPLGHGRYAYHVPNAVFASVGSVSANLTVSGAIDVHLDWEVVAVDRNSATRFGLTALPNAAADAAGGLPISNAGGLDLDAKIGALTFTVAGDVDVNVQTWGGTAISTPPAVNASQFGGATVTATTSVTIPAASTLATTTGAVGSVTSTAGFATPTNITAGTITTVTNLTNAPTSGDLTATMKASVNAEVLDVLSTDTFAELGAVPAATSSLKDKITYMFMWFRNKSTQTSTTRLLRNDADNATVATETVGDDGTTYTKGEAS